MGPLKYQIVCLSLVSALLIGPLLPHCYRGIVDAEDRVTRGYLDTPQLHQQAYSENSPVGYPDERAIGQKFDARFQTVRQPQGRTLNSTTASSTRRPVSAGHVDLSELYRGANLGDPLSDIPNISTTEPVFDMRPASYQEQRARTPTSAVPTTPSQTRSSRSATARSLAGTGVGLSLLSERRIAFQGAGISVVRGAEARFRVATDAGGLLGKALPPGVATQKRNYVVSEPRVRGSRIGTLGASGSHWVPARIDLDTAISKLDPNLISQLNLIKGPYSALNGPGTSFVDVELVPSPRSTTDQHYSGTSTYGFKSNLEQRFGQSLAIADRDWGLRAGFGHRRGGDYTDGAGGQVSAGYESKDIDLSLGFDTGSGRSVEVFYLRQDQEDLNLPGQAFDLDRLITDAVELTWSDQSTSWADALTIESWYNTTDLRGTLSTSIRAIVMGGFSDFLTYRTDVYSTSTGGRIQADWQTSDTQVVSAGVDARLVRQGLSEQAIVFGIPRGRSPIPDAATANPGLFIELVEKPTEHVVVSAGARFDIVASEVTEDAATINNLNRGPGPPNPFGIQAPDSVSNFIGSDDLDQSYELWSVFVSTDYELDETWTLSGAIGHGQRAPNLTELYATNPFMFVLQNGINTVTGNPFLDPERRTQIDLGISGRTERLSFGINGFYAWVEDYITFENTRVFRNRVNGDRLEQVNLAFVNTDLAVLSGVEAEADLQLTANLSMFGSMSFIRGTDRTRNGDFATKIHDRYPFPTSPFGLFDLYHPIERRAGEPRGSYADQLNPQTQPDSEALPGIPPLRSVIGLRLQNPDSERPWSIEVAARIVATQNRIAGSLEELPTGGFTTADLRGSWQVRPGVGLIAGIENFTDETYQEHFDFRLDDGSRVLRPGINYYFSTEFTY